MSWLAVFASAMAVVALVPPRHTPPSVARSGVTRPERHPAGEPPTSDWMARHRVLWALLAGIGGFTLLRGSLGPVGGVVAGSAAALGCWLMVTRAEPARARAERKELLRALPQVVRLLAAALASGASPSTALAAIAQAMPGVVERRLSRAVAQLRLGADPAEVWRDLAAEPGLAPLGRALARAHVTGAPIAVAVERLGEDLAREARADVEDRARAVGVKAAVPLGLCLLPAFVLIGIVPLVAGLFSRFSF